MDAANPQHGSAHTVVGPLLIAVTLNTFLYGICFLQFVRYFTSGTQDRLPMRLLIAWEVIIDTFHSALLVYMIWQYAISNFGNEAFLLEATPWSLISNPGLTALSACPIQAFLSYRVKKLSGSWIVFIPLLILSLAEGALGLATAAKGLQAKSLPEMLRTFPMLESFTAVSVATDVTISATLIFYLRKRNTGSRPTDHLISRLIRGTIESASLASIFAIMLPISGTVWPSTTIVTVFSLPMGRIYTSTFLAILNSRHNLLRKLHDDFRGKTTDPELVCPERTTGEISFSRQSSESLGVPSLNATTANYPNSSANLTDIETLQISASSYDGGLVLIQQPGVH
ncbi:hypothetical protein GYMLUDRAFT_399842 [Collybiopsis luxurians FD-317 M1]|nr:hypothetical protein GYMLUDRAFT_399842 [Collybiopsis luxurians FD-317 M1]